MKILVLNCGSSSLKYKLFEMDRKTILAQGNVEKIGLAGSFLKFSLPDGTKRTIESKILEHTAAVNIVLKVLTDPDEGAIRSLKEIDAVGNRIVQGGNLFHESVIVDDEVETGIESLIDLAPLHNLGHLKGIRAVKKLMPDVPQVVVFDTAFHHTMPDYAYMYAIPYELYEKYAIRRYGFHGTSHRYVSGRALDFLGLQAEGTKMITCHIGNGSSVAAVKDGKCVDTSMGLTPLEGLMMGSRSGDIDASAVTYIMDKEGLTPVGASNFLNKQCGLLGISGVSSDMREVDEAAVAGNKRAQLAQKMYYYRIKKYIGSYAAALGGLDILVFTAGVGENQSKCREEACEGLEFMGIKIDKEKNNRIHGTEALISTPDSKVKVLVIPTDEELMIASDTLHLLEKRK